MKNRHPQKLRYLVETYWLKPNREHLREKIAQRVRQMVEQGWLHEVKALLEKGIDPRLLENKPIGYAELAEVAEGFQPLEKIIEKIVQKTQQYAKRQDTFFRGLFEGPSYQNVGCTLVVI
jgi:tRNA dimethylallyltransferase